MSNKTIALSTENWWSDIKIDLETKVEKVVILDRHVELIVIEVIGLIAVIEMMVEESRERS